MTTNRCNCCDEQRHVHEIIGITETNVGCCEGHNHRIATVSGEAIEYCDNHVHEVTFRTDFADGHFHEFSGTSEPAVYVGDGKHVHYVNAETDCGGGNHSHRFQLASLIEEPTTFENDEDECDTCQYGRSTDCGCGCNGNTRGTDCGCGCNGNTRGTDCGCGCNGNTRGTDCGCGCNGNTRSNDCGCGCNR